MSGGDYYDFFDDDDILNDDNVNDYIANNDNVNDDNDDEMTENQTYLQLYSIQKKYFQMN